MGWPKLLCLAWWVWLGPAIRAETSLSDVSSSYRGHSLGCVALLCKSAGFPSGFLVLAVRYFSPELSSSLNRRHAKEMLVWFHMHAASALEFVIPFLPSLPQGTTWFGFPLDFTLDSWVVALYPHVMATASVCFIFPTTIAPQWLPVDAGTDWLGEAGANLLAEVMLRLILHVSGDIWKRWSCAAIRINSQNLKLAILAHLSHSILCSARRSVQLQL